VSSEARRAKEEGASMRRRAVARRARGSGKVA